MLKRAVISIIIITIVMLSFSGCKKEGIPESDMEKYNISKNSIVLQDILKNLYKDKNVKPIIYREQEGADAIFEKMEVKHEHFESYAFLYDDTKQEYIIIFHSAVFQDEFILMGIDRIFGDIFEKQGEQSYENLVYKDVGEFIIFIKHDKADEIFNEIKEGLINWDSSKVQGII